VLSNAIVAVAVAVPVPVPVTMSIASVHRGKNSEPDKGHDVQAWQRSRRRLVSSTMLLCGAQSYKKVIEEYTLPQVTSLSECHTSPRSSMACGVLHHIRQSPAIGPDRKLLSAIGAMLTTAWVA
jgi:hypothetical protein